MSASIRYLLALCLLYPAGSHAETAETILIRQVLEKDRSGRRRGDAELVMSAYDEDRFVVYDGAGSIDARAWSVTYDSRDDYEAALEADLTANRYDISRSVVFINVWKEVAFATTLDSGVVVDRVSGARRQLEQRSLWTFRKEDEEWLATGVVVALGDTVDGSAVGRVEDAEVAAALRDEAERWSEGDLGGITGTMYEDFVGVECHYSSNPAKWLTVFADRDETEEWLEERLEQVSYSVERTVLHAVARGDEAVAVTRDRVIATYGKGDASVEQDRISAWQLTRTGGRWQTVWVWWKVKPFGDLGHGSTALR